MSTRLWWTVWVGMSLALAVVASGATQAPASDEALREAVWAAVQPALPYPAATSDDMPVDGRPDARWLVRPADGVAGSDPARPASPLRVTDVVANPLNRENQARALQAMADIQSAVTAAERKAQAEFERTLGTTSRREPTRELSGISLDDEGVAGERADWEARLIVEARRGLARYEWPIAGSGSPTIAAVPNAASVSIGADEYDDAEGPDRRRRFRPAETRLFFGTSVPTVKSSGHGATVLVDGAAPDSVEVILRGHADLVKQVTEKADWSRVAALVKR